uniref:Uncharacterized protein n=1 Tax=Vespula pensylvanica TaxID=30213 RepID=A0A834NR72_VESPE|nr:hypothetical protein H0235_012580 [Vespula pensylvanica]
MDDARARRNEGEREREPWKSSNDLPKRSNYHKCPKNIRFTNVKLTTTMRTTETAVARSGGWATVLLTGTLNNATTLGYLRHGSGVARWKSDYGGGGK